MVEIETRRFDGTEYANKKLLRLTGMVKELKDVGIEIGMGSIYCKFDEGSKLYTRIKKRKAEEIGIRFEDFGVDEKNIPLIINQIEKLNNDSTIQLVLVQKPSGKDGFSDEEWDEIVSKIDPKKDVDGLVYWNLGHLLGTKEPPFLPATVRAVLEIMHEADFNPRGKNVVIIGSSIIMGLPLSVILTRQKATVSVLNDETEDVSYYTKKAKLIVTATGGHPIIARRNTQRGVAIIDVSSPGTDLVLDRKGNPEVLGWARFIASGRGSVGPVTVMDLLANGVESVYESAKKSGIIRSHTQVMLPG